MPENISSDAMQTMCTHCNCTFNISELDLYAADGQVRCSECDTIFSAYTHLKKIPTISNVAFKNDPVEETAPEEDQLMNNAEESELTQKKSESLDTDTNTKTHESTVSLHEAMHTDTGTDSNNRQNSFTSVAWLFGIIACVTIASLQWIYFDRHHLIKDARYQTVILSMCDYLNCDNRNFKNLNQFSLLERNIFTHPTHKKALLISGSYSNEAPFTQGAPNLKISMFNLQGNPIAQRIFHAEEYLSGNTPKQITSGETIHFKLEVADPNTVAITYEFEFI